MSFKPTPLDFLEAVYLNEQLPLTVRMRAAIEAALYVHPKRSSINVRYDDSFANRLELALRASNAQLIEARAINEEEN